LLAGLILVTTLATKKMWSPQKVATRADHHQGGTGQVLVDYQNVDYRGFLFVVHDIHGLMLLRCTRKKNKGPHWQVPGGHIDEPEFLAAGNRDNWSGNVFSVSRSTVHLTLPPSSFALCSSENVPGPIVAAAGGLQNGSSPRTVRRNRCRFAIESGSPHSSFAASVVRGHQGQGGAA
jgi:8-oxo-dGTP pyrophosphatase MutT (NUDIX family)